MQTLKLDFIQSHQPVWLGRILFLAAGIVLSYGLYQYQQLSAYNQKLDADLAQLHAARPKAAPVLNPQAAAELVLETKQAHEVATVLLFPWQELFTALEQSKQPHVSILSIEPDRNKQLLRITAETKKFIYITAWLKRLAELPQLRNTHLLRYDISEADALHPVRFTLEAKWSALP